MKNRIIVLVAAAVTMVEAGCHKEKIYGDGPLITETRTVGNFHGLALATPGKVNFMIGAVYSCEVRAQQNILDIMRTQTRDGILTIEFPRDVNVQHHDSIIINLVAPSVDYINLSGVGDITVIGNNTVNDLYLRTSGVGNIVIDHAQVTDKIDAAMSGAGKIQVINGAAVREELSISGSGDIDLGNIAAQSADITISGSGNMWVKLSQTLKAKISGSGSVYYRGSPSISTNISGSGVVRPF
jgi:hypothetical protein